MFAGTRAPDLVTTSDLLATLSLRLKEVSSAVQERLHQTTNLPIEMTHTYDGITASASVTAVSIEQLTTICTADGDVRTADTMQLIAQALSDQTEQLITEIEATIGDHAHSHGCNQLHLEGMVLIALRISLA